MCLPKLIICCGLLLPACLAVAEPSATQPATRPYRTAHEAPLNPSEKTVAKADRYTQLRVEFNGINGGRVPAFLYLPVDEEPTRHPAIVLQYGSGGSKKTNYIVALGQQFAGRGFVVLTIDIPNKGERRQKDRPVPIQSTFIETLGDYSRAVDYLETRPEVNPQRLGFVGISWGAITGIVYVAHDPRIQVMASIVGGGNFMGWLPGDISPEALAGARAIDPIYHVAAIAPRPLLLLNVTKDQLVPRFFAESLHKAAGPNAKKIWLETDHIFTGMDPRKIGEMIIQFVEDNMPAK